MKELRALITAAGLTTTGCVQGDTQTLELATRRHDSACSLK